MVALCGRDLVRGARHEKKSFFSSFLLHVSERKPDTQLINYVSLTFLQLARNAEVADLKVHLADVRKGAADSLHEIGGPKRACGKCEVVGSGTRRCCLVCKTTLWR